MNWTKADGAKIKITFSLPLVGSVSESASSFTVTAQEYDFVPNGTLHSVVKAVNSVAGFTGYYELLDLSSGVALVDTVVTNNALLLVVNHKSSGSAIIATAAITMPNISTSAISWTEDKPAGTNVVVKTSLNGTDYTTATNGGSFVSENLSSQAVYVKVELSTTDPTLTPSVSNIILQICGSEDAKSIILEMEPLERFESAVGDIVVAYNGAGGLSGTGGQVAPFSVSFTPTDLAYKGDQNDQEHIEISNVIITSVLTQVYYTSTAPQDQGHFEISGITASGILINVNDI